HVSFTEMVEAYADFEGEPELSQLKSYWAEEYDIVFPPGEAKSEAEAIEAGRELHEYSCAACHSKPAWGFISYGLAKALKPVAVGLSQSKFGLIIWRLHWLLIFACWALLPFSKFLHVLATPVNLIVNQETKEASADPAVAATKQALAMDACTHCGECSARCSVAASFRQIGNDNILPSEKLAALRRLLDGRGKNGRRIKALAEGAEICTLCGRCTTVCPAGIGLQELWLALDDELAARGVPTPFVAVREEALARYGGDGQGRPQHLPPLDGPVGLGYVHRPETFVNCFECQTCTNVCPVVANYDHPGAKLGLLPHQLMHSLSLGLSDLALGSRMVWDCLTCYQCQEQCPQGVDVADTLYELKNLAFDRLREAEI
ncbi:MAG: 4Fe-4S dicluster domain-containing protein, partial [Deltaproteobacteria bacterium]|nr:4Fe-4S dicluster domain-containing protein [Deltaproteobacteria bacterium]